MDTRVPQLVAISYAIYSILLLAYPRDFRRAFGDEMAQVFCQCCKDVYRHDGAAGLSAVWAHTLLDTIGNVAREYALLERVQALAFPASAGHQVLQLARGDVYSCPYCGEEIPAQRQRCIYCGGDLSLCPPRLHQQSTLAARPRKSPGYSAVQLATDAQRFYDWAYGEPANRD